jgi:hypothetical protein
VSQSQNYTGVDREEASETGATHFPDQSEAPDPGSVPSVISKKILLSANKLLCVADGSAKKHLFPNHPFWLVAFDKQ